MIFLSFFVWKNEKDMKMRVQDDRISKKEFDFWKERVEKPLNASRNLEKFQNFNDFLRSYKGENFQILAW